MEQKLKLLNFALHHQFPDEIINIVEQFTKPLKRLGFSIRGDFQSKYHKGTGYGYLGLTCYISPKVNDEILCYTDYYAFLCQISKITYNLQKDAYAFTGDDLLQVSGIDVDTKRDHVWVGTNKGVQIYDINFPAFIERCPPKINTINVENPLGIAYNDLLSTMIICNGKKMYIIDTRTLSTIKIIEINNIAANVSKMTNNMALINSNSIMLTTNEGEMISQHSNKFNDCDCVFNTHEDNEELIVGSHTGRAHLYYVDQNYSQLKVNYDIFMSGSGFALSESTKCVVGCGQEYITFYQ